MILLVGSSRHGSLILLIIDTFTKHIKLLLLSEVIVTTLYITRAFPALHTLRMPPTSGNTLLATSSSLFNPLTPSSSPITAAR